MCILLCNLALFGNCFENEIISEAVRTDADICKAAMQNILCIYYISFLYRILEYESDIQYSDITIKYMIDVIEKNIR